MAYYGLQFCDRVSQVSAQPAAGRSGARLQSEALREMLASSTGDRYYSSEFLGVADVCKAKQLTKQWEQLIDHMRIWVAENSYRKLRVARANLSLINFILSFPQFLATGLAEFLACESA